MGMKASEIVVKSSLDLRSAGRIVNQVFAQERAEVEKIDLNSNPLDALEGQPDIAVVGSRQGKLNQWAVQVYLEAGDQGTVITLIALGDSGFSRAMGGTKYTASLSKSTAERDKIVAALRSADPGLVQL